MDREEYLLGRAVDQTLENLNNEEKQKQQSFTGPPKSRVEHECIPPSIRDFNKVAQAEQVDLSAKLQEDPLVTIKKREEESRRQFLQNPVQLKKLQKALKAQEAIKKKKKNRKSKERDLDAKLKEKLLGIKSKKVSKEEKSLDIILMHKYEALKHKLSDGDIRDILNGEFTGMLYFFSYTECSMLTGLRVGFSKFVIHYQLHALYYEYNFPIQNFFFEH